MARVSFQKPNAASQTIAEQVETPVAGVTVETTTGIGGTNLPAVLPAAPPPAALAFCDDEAADLSQIRIPHLNIVQKVGPMSELFTAGYLVLNRELVVYKPGKPAAGGEPEVKGTPPLEVIVLAFRPDQYTEKVEGGAGGRLFDRKEEVVACGGTLDWGTAQATNKPLFQPLATAAILIRKPEHVTDESQFVHEVDGGKYAFALWSMKGGAYTKGAKVFRTAKTIGLLRGKPYSNIKWSVGTKCEQYKTGNFAWAPVVTPSAETSAALREYATNLVRSIAG